MTQTPTSIPLQERNIMKGILDDEKPKDGAILPDSAKDELSGPRDRRGRIASVLVKPRYHHVYEGDHFKGMLKSEPRQHHGAWICELYLEDDRTAVVFRLGHLDALTRAQGEIDLLSVAEDAGWNKEVAAQPLEVTLWTARDCASEMVHVAGRPGVEQGNMVMPTDAGDAEWRCLEDNLGRHPEREEQLLFQTEFRRVLSDPATTNEWPEG